MHAESSWNELLAYTIKGKGEALLWVSQIGHSFKVIMIQIFFFFAQIFRLSYVQTDSDRVKDFRKT